MRITRALPSKRSKANPSADKPEWLYQAEALPNRNFITISEKRLVDLVRKHGEFTKASLVLQTDFSRTKITSCIASLLNKKIIVANQNTEYSGGRRSKTYSLNGNLGLVAGVDIGATSIDLSILDFSGNRIARYAETASVKDGPITVLGRVSSLLEKMLKEQNLSPEKVRGIGIGVPGPVDFSAGTLVSPPIMPGWDEYPIIQTVQQWFPSANVVVDNDVNVMALGEIHRGAGGGVDNLIFVKIGTGIGAGIVCDGRIYRGANGCAGDIGHISVNKFGPLCRCGNTGCLEAVAGGPAIARRAVDAAQAGRSSVLMKYFEKNGKLLRAEDVGEAAREGDPLAIEIIRESGQSIGDVLASLVNFYNPQMIVIGGGVILLGNLLLSSIRQAVLQRSTALATRDLRIVFSEIGPDAGVIGAVHLAMDYMFSLSPVNSSTN
ncbi:MAG TPA: ROK family protein [Anaerolineales bacterium]|nr:ROK family protein [Anaerolineales bacterium]